MPAKLLLVLVRIQYPEELPESVELLPSLRSEIPETREFLRGLTGLPRTGSASAGMLGQISRLRGIKALRFIPCLRAHWGLQSPQQGCRLFESKLRKHLEVLGAVTLPT